MWFSAKPLDFSLKPLVPLERSRKPTESCTTLLPRSRPGEEHHWPLGKGLGWTVWRKDWTTPDMKPKSVSSFGVSWYWAWLRPMGLDPLGHGTGLGAGWAMLSPRRSTPSQAWNILALASSLQDLHRFLCSPMTASVAGVMRHTGEMWAGLKRCREITSWHYLFLAGPVDRQTHTHTQ